MTYKAILMLIQNGKIDGLADKIDVLFVLGRLSQEEHIALLEMFG